MSKYVISSAYPEVVYQTEGDVEHVTLGNFTFTSVSPQPNIVVTSDMSGTLNMIPQQSTNVIIKKNMITNLVSNTTTVVHQDLGIPLNNTIETIQQFPFPMTNVTHSSFIRF